MKILLKAVITVLIASSVTCQAVMIGFFPGIDKAVERADSIAIVRIDEHIQPVPDPNLITRHRCYVYQTLKGDLKAGQRIALDLIDTRTSFVSPFPILSTHLVFLSKSGGTYRNLHFQGSDLRLSPFGNENLPEGETVQAKIKGLIERSITYWAKEWQKERDFLEEVRK